MTTLTLHDYTQDMTIEAERTGAILTTKAVMRNGEWTRVRVLLRRVDGKWVEEILE